MQAQFGPGLWGPGGQHAALIQRCSLVVGLHPDQASSTARSCQRRCCRPVAMCGLGQCLLHMQTKRPLASAAADAARSNVNPLQIPSMVLCTGHRLHPAGCQ